MSQILKYRQPEKWEWSHSGQKSNSGKPNVLTFLILKLTAILKVAAYFFLAPFGLIIFILINLFYRRQIISLVDKY